jgi:hypothetical protein
MRVWPELLIVVGVSAPWLRRVQWRHVYRQRMGNRIRPENQLLIALGAGFTITGALARLRQ